MRNWKLAGAVALVVVLAGCGGGKGDPPTASPSSAAPTSSGPKRASWDPCKSLPDEAIRAGAANPETREEGMGGLFKDWNVCSWDSFARDPSGISSLWNASVMSGLRSLAETHGHPQFESFTPIMLGTRKAEVAPDKPGDPPSPDRGCTVIVPNSEGTVLITMTWHTRQPPENPCNVVTRLGMAFQNHLPAN